MPAPFLRAVYPRGLDGCWLIDSVAPDAHADERADGHADGPTEESAR